MTEDNNDEAVNDLFKRLEKAIGNSLNGIFDSLNPEASEKAMMGEFVAKTFDAKKRKVAEDFNQVDVAVAMLLAGYILSPALKGISSFDVMVSLREVKAVEAFVADMRSNGMEVSFDQVAEAIDKVMSYVVEFGLAAIQHGFMLADVDCAPPKARNRKFEDLGIEDPFKEN